MTLAVVFDVDDTLYLERDYVRSGFKAVADHLEVHHGVDGFVEVAWQLFESGVRNTIFDTALEQIGLDPETMNIGQLVEVYRAHDPQIQTTQDAQCLLKDIVGKDRTAVITDGPPSSQRAKIRALGVAAWSELTICTGELGENKGKPHPESFLSVMEFTGLDPDRHIYIGDNPAKDFVAPSDLGWFTIRVRRSGQLHENRASGTDVSYETPDLAGLSLLIQDMR